MASVSSQGTNVHDIEQLVEGIKAKSVTFKNTKGYFVSMQRLENIQHAVECLLSDSAEAGHDVQKLTALQEQIDQMAAASNVANAALAEAKAKAHSCATAYTKQKEVTDEVVKKSNVLLDELKTSRAELQHLQKEASDLNQRCKAAEKAAGKGFDPEAVTKAVEEHQQALAQLQNVQNQLEQANRTIKNVTHEKDVVQKALVAAAREREDAQIRLNELQTLRTEALADVPIRKVDVELNSTLVSAILGDKGLSWVKKAAEAKEVEVREKIYNLMNAARSVKGNRVISGIGDLLQVAFDWVKTQSHKARQALQAWISELEEDFRKGVFKQLKYYREQLEKVVGALKTKSSAKLQKVKENFKKQRTNWFNFMNIWYECCSWGLVLKHRIKRQINSVSKVLSSFWNSWFVAKPNEHFSEDFKPHVVFDMEKEVADRTKLKQKLVNAKLTSV